MQHIKRQNNQGSFMTSHTLHPSHQSIVQHDVNASGISQTHKNTTHQQFVSSQHRPAQYQYHNPNQGQINNYNQQHSQYNQLHQGQRNNYNQQLQQGNIQYNQPYKGQMNNYNHQRSNQPYQGETQYQQPYNQHQGQLHHQRNTPMQGHTYRGDVSQSQHNNSIRHTQMQHQSQHQQGYKFGDVTRSIVAKGKKASGRNEDDGYKFGKSKTRMQNTVALLIFTFVLKTYVSV